MNTDTLRARAPAPSPCKPHPPMLVRRPSIVLAALLISGVGCDTSPIPTPVGSCIYSSFFLKPAWNPGGDEIAVEHADSLDTDGDGVRDDYVWGTYIVDIRTGTPKLLLRSYGDPDWSPDGGQLAIEDHGDIFTVPYSRGKVDLSAIRRLTSGGNSFRPTWSPDGKWILYGRNESIKASGEGAETNRIVKRVDIILSDGSQRRTLKIDIDTDFDEVDWSSSGRSIVGIGYPSPGGGYDPRKDGSEIIVIDTSGSVVVRVTNNRREEGLPVWSPDGSRIGYISSDMEGTSRLRFARKDGTDIGELPFDDVAGFDWSPDGTQLVLVRDSGQKDRSSGQLWIVDINGSQIKRITDFYPASGERVGSCDLG